MAQIAKLPEPYKLEPPARALCKLLLGCYEQRKSEPRKNRSRPVDLWTQRHVALTRPRPLAIPRPAYKTSIFLYLQSG
jgi:hypothetical protein